MTKRTSINLDVERLEEAKAVLGTRETTETIHRALDEVVRQSRLQRLARRRFEFTDADLAQLRRPRTEDAPAVNVSRRVSA
jgi:hypothetical protein